MVASCVCLSSRFLPRWCSVSSSSKAVSKWSSRAPLLRPVTNTNSSMPAARHSSTAYWISGRSTTVNISLGIALVAGRKRVPNPATGRTALRTCCGMLHRPRYAYAPRRKLLPHPGRPRKFDHLLATKQYVLCAVDARGEVGGPTGVRMRTADQAAMGGPDLVLAGAFGEPQHRQRLLARHAVAWSAGRWLPRGAPADVQPPVEIGLEHAQRIGVGPAFAMKLQEF